MPYAETAYPLEALSWLQADQEFDVAILDYETLIQPIFDDRWIDMLRLFAF